MFYLLLHLDSFHALVFFSLSDFVSSFFSRFAVSSPLLFSFSFITLSPLTSQNFWGFFFLFFSLLLFHFHFIFFSSFFPNSVFLSVLFNFSVLYRRCVAGASGAPVASCWTHNIADTHSVTDTLLNPHVSV